MRARKWTTNLPRMMATGVAALLALGLVLSLTRPGEPTQPDDAIAPTSEQLISTNLEDTVPSGLADVLKSGPVTVPGDDAFTPYRRLPKACLRSMKSKRWLEGDRTFWWSENYSPSEPAEVTVTAEHLNGSAPTVKYGAVVGSGFNPFMLAPTHESVTMVGVGKPESGCWELTAEYRGASLSYVVWVSDT
jgi:hypothetical protein